MFCDILQVNDFCKLTNFTIVYIYIKKYFPHAKMLSNRTGFDDMMNECLFCTLLSLSLGQVIFLEMEWPLDYHGNLRRDLMANM